MRGAERGGAGEHVAGGRGRARIEPHRVLVLDAAVRLRRVARVLDVGEPHAVRGRAATAVRWSTSSRHTQQRESKSRLSSAAGSGSGSDSRAAGDLDDGGLRRGPVAGNRGLRRSAAGLSGVKSQDAAQ